MGKGTVNKVIILGRLGKDPELSQTAGGTQVAKLSVATNEIGAKDQSGQRQTTTEWHYCVLFGVMADNAGKYLQKGSQVYLEGRLQTRKWQDKNTGQDRYSTEIVCNEMQFIGGGDQQNRPQQGFNKQPQQQAFNQQTQQQMAPNPQAGGFDEFSDDIPF